MRQRPPWTCRSCNLPSRGENRRNVAAAPGGLVLSHRRKPILRVERSRYQRVYDAPGGLAAYHFAKTFLRAVEVIIVIEAWHSIGHVLVKFEARDCHPGVNRSDRRNGRGRGRKPHPAA